MRGVKGRAEEAIQCSTRSFLELTSLLGPRRGILRGKGAFVVFPVGCQLHYLNQRSHGGQDSKSLAWRGTEKGQC